MKPKQRLAAVARGEKADRIPFMPTILEHAAALIGKTPSEVAVDAKLLEEAHIAAYDKYGHDFITVGMDVYNLEAEALGCTIRYHDDCSIPGILTHPLENHFDTGYISFSEDMGRIGLTLDAAENVRKRVGNEVGVGIGICGPFSIAAELYGYENLIADMLCEDSRVDELLNAVLEFQKDYCSSIISRGLGITIFESWATPPLVSPDLYSRYVMPYEARLIEDIKSKGQPSAPLVIGGDTSQIVDSMMDTGTTLLVADFKVDVEAYLKKAKERKLILRGNIDPKLIEKGPVEEIIDNAKKLIQTAGEYERFVLGTGVIPYNTPPENILAVKALITA